MSKPWKPGMVLPLPKGYKFEDGKVSSHSKLNERIIGNPTEGRCRACGIGAGMSRFRVIRTVYKYQHMKHNGKRMVRVLDVKNTELPDITHTHQNPTLENSFCAQCADLMDRGKLQIRNGKIWYWNPDVLGFLRDIA